MAHTPGPWYSAYSKTDEFGGGNIRSNHHVDGTGALLFDAGPMFHDYEVNREEELANLRLAAAAPDLLEALVDLVEIVDDDHYKCDLDSDEYCDVTDEDSWHVKHHNLRLAKQVIAMAKGVTV